MAVLLTESSTESTLYPKVSKFLNKRVGKLNWIYQPRAKSAESDLTASFLSNNTVGISVKDTIKISI